MGANFWIITLAPDEPDDAHPRCNGCRPAEAQELLGHPGGHGEHFDTQPGRYRPHQTLDHQHEPNGSKKVRHCLGCGAPGRGICTPEGDPDLILEDMDLDSIDVQVMHPNLSLFGLYTDDHELSIAHARVYNDYVVERFSPHFDRICPTAPIPL